MSASGDNLSAVQPASVAARWHDYLQITKPRVVALAGCTSVWFMRALVGRGSNRRSP